MDPEPGFYIWIHKHESKYILFPFLKMSHDMCDVRICNANIAKCIWFELFVVLYALCRMHYQP